ncbi:hypothetical protein JCM16303_001026 [Sporobolomyces ruberrimus]
MTDSAAFSILRIKRKRTTNQLPLDALVIEQPEPSTKRRKATHVQTPAPPPPPSRGIFRFAETVSIDSFDNPTKTRQVKDRIQSFLTRPSPSISLLQKEQRPLARIPSSASLRNQPTSTPPSPVSTPKKSGRKLPSSAASLVQPSASASTSLGSPLNNRQSNTSPLPSHLPLSSLNPSNTGSVSLALQRKRTRYRIVTEPTPSSTLSSTSDPRELERAREREAYLQELQEDEEIRRGLRPPRVRSLAELKAREERETRRKREEEEEQVRSRGTTRIYDAIAEDEEEDERLMGRSGKKKFRRESKGKRQVDPVEDQDMMDNFGDMLKEYLTLQDSTERNNTASPLFPSMSSSTPRSIPEPTSVVSSEDEGPAGGEESDSGGEFVYDVYYRDLRETPGSGQNASSTALNGTPQGNGPTGFDVSSLEGLKRIGELAGLEEDEDLLLRADGEGDSESEEEDNADQDSNEENDYRNDYPDEESEDEDRWGDHDDEEDDSDQDDRDY